MALARDCSVFGLNILQQAWIPVLLLSTRTQQNARGTGWEQTFKAPSAGKQRVLQGPCPPPRPPTRTQLLCHLLPLPPLLSHPCPKLPSPRDPQGRADPHWRNIIQYPPSYKRGPQKGGTPSSRPYTELFRAEGGTKGPPHPLLPTLISQGRPAQRASHTSLSLQVHD